MRRRGGRDPRSRKPPRSATQVAELAELNGLSRAGCEVDLARMSFGRGEAVAREGPRLRSYVIVPSLVRLRWDAAKTSSNCVVASEAGSRLIGDDRQSVARRVAAAEVRDSYRTDHD
jgi:hypothetical protein